MCGAAGGGRTTTDWNVSFATWLANFPIACLDITLATGIYIPETCTLVFFSTFRPEGILQTLPFWMIWNFDFDVFVNLLIWMQKHDNSVSILWDSWKHDIRRSNPCAPLENRPGWKQTSILPGTNSWSSCSSWVRTCLVQVKGSIPTPLSAMSTPSTNVLVE